MASLLRQIVAGPRAKHQETGLDLCYVASNIIATSGPSQTYPQRAYRNPLDRLVSFLDAQHGDGWAIWEFRAEGTGYPDDAVHGRVSHYPWPDHHPPPFRVVPMVMGGMRNWLRGGKLHGGSEPSASCSALPPDGETGENGKGKGKGRVVVVHCKAGKGRSGTMACSYLIAECGWTAEDALARFTERRMRPGFGAGVSIPSQLRWVSYVDRWTKGGKKYVDRAVEIVEVHVWGLRHGVKVSVAGFVDEGKKIKMFHTFSREERIVVEGDAPGGGGVVDMVQDMAGYGAKATVDVDETGEILEDADYEGIKKGNGNGNGDDGKGKDNDESTTPKYKGPRASSLMRKLSSRRQGSWQNLTKLGKDGQKSKTIALQEPSQAAASSTASLPAKSESRSQSTASLQNNNGFAFANSSEPGGQAVVFKPAEPIRIPNSDVNISIERRNRAPAGMSLTMVTAIAHVWFNTFFEGNGPEQDGKADESGVFSIDWEKMDGLKGSSQKGTRALERLSVVWRVAGTGEPGPGGEAVPSPGVAIDEPSEDGPVPQMQPADWKGNDVEDPTASKRLGLRVEEPDSQAVSKASSIKSQEMGEEGETAAGGKDGDDQASLEGVKVSGPAGEELLGADTKE